MCTKLVSSDFSNPFLNIMNEIIECVVSKEHISKECIVSTALLYF